ncbi:hypothetical protein B0H65DRAFT_124298 [Neurospora tetraspora]|uniref:Uncharacterized protein n=1 Tax=Neurospora tetraspora TaxID=94610 RepID=A0AAE0JKQ5_9PEZI|nr:hypothetical protein B0H65DRAFT_124298 [Neurospora tetraspora]
MSASWLRLPRGISGGAQASAVSRQVPGPGRLTIDERSTGDEPQGRHSRRVKRGHQIAKASIARRRCITSALASLSEPADVFGFFPQRRRLSRFPASPSHQPFLILLRVLWVVLSKAIIARAGVSDLLLSIAKWHFPTTNYLHRNSLVLSPPHRFSFSHPLRAYISALPTTLCSRPYKAHAQRYNTERIHSTHQGAGLELKVLVLNLYGDALVQWTKRSHCPVR